MKRLALIIAIIISMLPAVGASDVSAQNQQSMVWIVLSPNAYAYHRTTNCRAVRQATHDIKSVPIDAAIAKYHRRACGYCYR